MTEPQKVAEWMHGLGFVKGQHYFTHKETEMDISLEEATFFYNSQQANTRSILDRVEAEAPNKLRAMDKEKAIWIEGYNRAIQDARNVLARIQKEEL